jgi:hypothetical protein
MLVTLGVLVQSSYINMLLTAISKPMVMTPPRNGMIQQHLFGIVENIAEDRHSTALNSSPSQKNVLKTAISAWCQEG